MNVRIIRKIPVNATLEKLIREQVVQRLQRFAKAISGVQVELSDKNNRRGGGDKRCRVELVLAEGGKIRMDDSGANLRTLIRHVASRTENEVRRHVRLLGM
jgi:ribosome-associated translation inhibitor RaiA